MVRLTRVYATAPVPAAAQRAFDSLGPVQLLAPDWSDLDQAEVLLVRAEELRAAEIRRATSLRVIARTGSGVDNVDVAAATERGVPVVYAPAAGSRPVAEGTIALMLAAMKRLGQLHGTLESGAWPQRYEIEIADVRGATLGVVGLGRIGREVAQLAAALGMTVVSHDPIAADGDEGDIELLELGALLGRSDVVTLHCPLTSETRGLIDAGALDRMKRGAVLVNVARGEIIADQRLLIEALDRGQLSAVALDVFAVEPPAPSNPLLHDPRVICTPHSIGLTISWNERVFSALAADVERCLRDEAPVNVVDAAALESAAGRA
ncbi:MAG: oxidoreductase [Actinobacteria bacterium]|nr:oxidoreductase [Actinomycetota bacterium]